MPLQRGVAGEITPRITWVGLPNEKERIGEGEHERFIVNMARFLEKVAQKGGS